MPLPLQVFLGKRYTGKSESISIRPTSGLISLNQGVSKLLSSKYLEDLTHVQLLFLPDNLKTFWIRPCGPKDSGARKLNGDTNVLSCKPFFYEINYTSEKTLIVPTVWDSENDALKVELPDCN